jgi:hypothetical protein
VLPLASCAFLACVADRVRRLEWFSGETTAFHAKSPLTKSLPHTGRVDRTTTHQFRCPQQARSSGCGADNNILVSLVESLRVNFSAEVAWAFTILHRPCLFLNFKNTLRTFLQGGPTGAFAHRVPGLEMTLTSPPSHWRFNFP